MPDNSARDLGVDFLIFFAAIVSLFLLAWFINYYTAPEPQIMAPGKEPMSQSTVVGEPA